MCPALASRKWGDMCAASGVCGAMTGGDEWPPADGAPATNDSWPVLTSGPAADGRPKPPGSAKFWLPANRTGLAAEPTCALGRYGMVAPLGGDCDRRGGGQTTAGGDGRRRLRHTGEAVRRRRTEAAGEEVIGEVRNERRRGRDKEGR